MAGLTYYNRSTHFNHLTINIVSQIEIKKPEMEKNTRFYKISSPEKFKLRIDHYLDSKFDIETPERIEAWLNILPSFKNIGLHIEYHDWKTNKTKDNTIQLHLLNRRFNFTVDIKNKPMYWIYFFIRQKI